MSDAREGDVRIRVITYFRTGWFGKKKPFANATFLEQFRDGEWAFIPHVLEEQVLGENA